MKKGLLIWNVLLTIAAGFLLITYFVSGKKAGTGKSVAADTSSNRPFRMAYLEMDSIEANFNLVKEVKSELSKKEDGNNIEIDRLNKGLQDKKGFYEGKQSTMTQQDYEAAINDLRNMEQSMVRRKQQLDQEYSELVMLKMNDIKTKIKDFLKEYNKTKKFSYIVSYGDADGFLYYKDTVYNITSDVIRGLNEIYKNKKN